MKVTSKIYKKYYPYHLPFNPASGMDVFTPTEIASPIEDASKEFKKNNCYSANTKLMKAGVEFPYTEAQLSELAKCATDVIYFITNYCKVITLSGGIDLFKLYQYQKNTIKVIHENRFSIFKFPRQMGKCVTGKTDITIRVNGNELDLTFDQFYDMIDVENIVESYSPNHDYEILTQYGFKGFDGITTRYTDILLHISMDNGTFIKVTPDHEVMKYDGTFVTAKSLSVGDTLGVEEPSLITSIETLTGDFRVADMIDVKDTRSFGVNDLSTILSNCIDGSSVITLLDNHTGEIFDIPIEQLFDFLSEGAK